MAYRLTPAALRQLWADYSKKCDTGFTETVRYRDGVVEVPKRLIYNMDSFCCFAGIPEGRLDVLEKNKNYRKTVKTIKLAVRARKIDALLNDEGSSNGLIFDLKSNHGMYAKRAGDAPDSGWGVTLNMDETVDSGKANDKSTSVTEDTAPAAGEPKEGNNAVPAGGEPRQPEPAAPPPQPPPPPKPVYAQYCVY